MHSRRPLISVVLAAALLGGLWHAASHANEHALQAGAAHSCATCQFSNSAGSGLAHAVPTLSLAFGSESPAAALATAPQRLAPRHHPIRGPPALLA